LKRSTERVTHAEQYTSRLRLKNCAVPVAVNVSPDNVIVWLVTSHPAWNPGEPGGVFAGVSNRISVTVRSASVAPVA
jgi:hypothetical protein